MIGVLALLMALGVLIWGGNWGLARWIAAALLAAAGWFGLYEARRGWCVARAMGFRTPF